MKTFFLLSFFVSSVSALAAQPQPTPSLDCFSAIRAYDASSSEVEYNANREIALDACAQEFRKDAAANRIVRPLLAACEKLDGPTGAADAGPHLMDSCKVDGYRYGLNFL